MYAIRSYYVCKVCEQKKTFRKIPLKIVRPRDTDALWLIIRFFFLLEFMFDKVTIMTFFITSISRLSVFNSISVVKSASHSILSSPYPYFPICFSVTIFNPLLILTCTPFFPILKSNYDFLLVACK